jgi:hypothetical protein
MDIESGADVAVVHLWSVDYFCRRDEA